jgi:hypothetical protein
VVFMTDEPLNGAAGSSDPVTGNAGTQKDRQNGSAGKPESAAVEPDSVDADGEPIAADADFDSDEGEVVDGVPVLADVRPLERGAPPSLPAVQAAAAAGAGFVAGAATIALVKRHAARKAARQVRGGSRRPADLLPIAATRSFLVDVHVIAKPD